MSNNSFLFSQLVQKELKARYKQAVVGSAWVILNPVAQVVVYTFVFSTILGFQSVAPYPLFLLTGLLPWLYFQQVIMTASNTLVNQSSLIKQVYFPRELIPFANIAAKGIDFLISAVVLSGVFIYFNFSPVHTWWYVAPLLLLQLVLMAGLSLMIAALNLVFRDVQYLTQLAVMIWMYLTPVVYPMSQVPSRYLFLFRLNPMTGIVEGYRAAILGYPLDWSAVGWSMVVTAVIFIVGYWLFRQLEGIFADVI